VPALLEARGLVRRFGGVTAVDGATLVLAAGEVVALVGDNGAGKSTLVGLVAGVHRPDGGELLMDGEPVRFGSPQQARRAGIETIHQDLALCDNLDAAHNLFLGREPVRRRLGFLPEVDRRAMVAGTRRTLDRLGIDLPDLRRPVRSLSGGQRQAIAIARAIHWDARLVIMDEPTAALGVPEQRRVLALVRTLRQEGVAVLLISHHLPEVLAVADRVAVMRRGRIVADLAVAETDENALVAHMVGAALG
jgi:ABC-type sugar transport system ATPase subunit